jgi:ATP-dependent HslUV protease, peptidase subunit HslV
MTTIVVVKKGGIAAIAADSLTTFGNTRLSHVYDAAPEKILQHDNTFIALAGSAAHHLVISSMLRRRNGLNFGSTVEIYDTFRKMHPVLKQDHFLNPREQEDDPYESSQLTVLIANKTGVYGVYSMREVFEYSKFWAIGSGRDFAMGAMYTVYDKLATAEEIARVGVQAGCEFDTDSALPINVYTVSVDK